MTRCSVGAELEHLPGTAPHVVGWLIVEQPGPWGRDALADSRLPDGARDFLQQLKADGWGVLLARHDRRRDPVDRHVWVTQAGGPLRHDTIDSIDHLPSVDLSSLRAGDPSVFVCTHSKRDECCAVLGRPLAIDNDAWQCSHVGGHRFAPVALELPTGNVYGRVSNEDVVSLRDGIIPLHRLRGCSFDPPAVQVARHCVEGVTAIAQASIEERHAVVDFMAGETAYRAHLELVPTGLVRPESCGGDPLPAHSWTVADLQVR